jgi:hypothetical protein
MTVKSVPPVRVILDVGAQVLELHNEEVAKKWLSMIPKKETQVARILSNEMNESNLLYRP